MPLTTDRASGFYFRKELDALLLSPGDVQDVGDDKAPRPVFPLIRIDEERQERDGKLVRFRQSIRRMRVAERLEDSQHRFVEHARGNLLQRKELPGGALPGSATSLAKSGMEQEYKRAGIEPPLEDLLNDRIAHLIMRGDGITLAGRVAAGATVADGVGGQAAVARPRP